MYLRRIPTEDIRRRYNAAVEVWPASDSWHSHLRARLNEALAFESRNLELSADARILNIGSRGSHYSFTSENHFHLDLCEIGMAQISLFVRADAHLLPFASGSFDLILMIGSVINYCDAARLISECARWMKQNAILVFDFENLRTWEYWRHWRYNIALASTDYAGTREKIWVYSPVLIEAMLEARKLSIERKVYVHTLTGLFLELWDSEPMRRFLSRFDRFGGGVPIVRVGATSILLTCRKCF